MEKASTFCMQSRRHHAPIYAANGPSDEKITELLEAETWMLADKVVEPICSDARCPDTVRSKKQDESVQECDRYELCIQHVAVKQADAKPMQAC